MWLRDTFIVDYDADCGRGRAHTAGGICRLDAAPSRETETPRCVANGYRASPLQSEGSPCAA